MTKVITDPMVEAAAIAMADKAIEVFGEKSQGPWDEWHPALQQNTRMLIRAGLEAALGEQE